MNKDIELIKSFTEEDYKFHRVNLHIHTTYSDGAGDFASLVRQADGYKAIAISDHNTIEGYLENPIPDNVIPSVEFDVWCGYVFMHLLAYGIDVNSDELKPFLAKSKKARVRFSLKPLAFCFTRENRSAMTVIGS